METSSQRFHRVLGAFEAWCADASFLLKTEQFAAAAEKQALCQSAIDELALLLRQPEIRLSLTSATRLRINHISDTYQQEAKRLAAQKAEVRSRLDALGAKQSRAKSFRGAYLASNLAADRAFVNQA